MSGAPSDRSSSLGWLETWDTMNLAVLAFLPPPQRFVIPSEALFSGAEGPAFRMIAPQNGFGPFTDGVLLLRKAHPAGVGNPDVQAPRSSSAPIWRMMRQTAFPATTYVVNIDYAILAGSGKTRSGGRRGFSTPTQRPRNQHRLWPRRDHFRVVGRVSTPAHAFAESGLESGFFGRAFSSTETRPLPDHTKILVKPPTCGKRRNPLNPKAK